MRFGYENQKETSGKPPEDAPADPRMAATQNWERPGERLRLAGRIRLANIWARKHPKRTFACVTGTLSLLLVCSLVTGGNKLDNADTHDISTVASMEPLFQGFRTIQSNKGLHRATMLELADSGRAIRRELDSLIAMPKKSHGDSLRIVRQYRRLENIVEFINNGEHG